MILYFLSKNPHVLAKLQKVHPLRGKDDLTIDDFKNLPYMEAVMKETRRIYWSTICLFAELIYS
jgi:cytochrome P450